MAQTIQLKRGGVGALSTAVTATTGEVLIVTGSSGDLQGPFLVVGVGETSASLVNPLQLGGTPPTLNDDNKQLVGTLFYNTGSNQLYRLENGSTTEITLGSVANEARFALTGSSNFFKDTQFITGSDLKGAPGAGTGTAVQKSDNYALLVSQSVYAYNHNVGYPTSNAWKSNLEGSYFNTFDANTDVSEILRFVAGLLSSSAASPSANTKTYNGITGVAQNSTTSANPLGYVPQNATNTVVSYLETKGFASDGNTIFSGVTGITDSAIQRNSSYNYKFNSDPAGTTNVRSSADDELFGIGELSDNNGLFGVSASYFWRFENNTSRTSTNTSQSAFVIELTSTSYPETSGGVTKNKINTDNPSVIPPQFQDGKFDLTATAGINFETGPTLTAKESTGFYEITASIGIKTGSQTDAAGYDNTLQESKNRIFYSPIYANSTIDTDDIGQNSITHTIQSSSLTAVSNSLSGAPYLVSATYDIKVTSSGLFDPLYSEAAAIWSVTSDDAKVSIANTDQDMSSGNISGDSFVFSSDLSTQRSAGTVPHQDDKIKVNRTLTFSAGTGDNIDQTSLSSDTGFGIDIVGYNRRGTTQDSTATFAFHSASDFGQPGSSGSMAYHNPAASNSSNNTNEYFEDETRRVQLNGSNINSTTNLDLGTASNIYNSGSALVTSNPRALQVKPGFLISPGGGNAYWHGSDYFGASNYYWFIREFDTNVSVNKNDFTIQFNGISTSDIQDWDATANDKISFGIIMQSSNAKLFDINQSDDDVGIGSTSTDAALNPFSNAIDIRGNTGRTISGTSNPTYTVKVNDGQGMTLNSSNDKFWLVIRYKGDPTPITSITTNL